MDIAIAPETPLQDDVRRLVAELNAFLKPQTPIAYQFQLTVEQMADPSLTLFVARDESGEAVGMGGLKDHGEGLGEVKRMFTSPQVRGQRVGAKLLQRIEALAHDKGLSRIVLETGEAPAFADAYRVYERAGFNRCGAVLDYPDSAFSRFYEKKIS